MDEKIVIDPRSIQHDHVELEYHSRKFSDCLLKKSLARKRVEDYLEEKRLRENIGERYL